MVEIYRPHTYPEIEGLIAPEVAPSPDGEKLYGAFWYNRARVTRKRLSSPSPDVREYRCSTTRERTHANSG